MFGFFSKRNRESKESLDRGISKTKAGLFAKFARALTSRSKVDDDFLDELEEILISADVGVETTLKIIDRIKARALADHYLNTEELQAMLREEIRGLLADAKVKSGATSEESKPYVILVVGVNGVGKTTTIGKLAYLLGQGGKKVYIGAADTFRAAAIDQLAVWAERAGATLIKQQMGADPASVAFDTLNAACANNADVVLVDTAGRLHNKVNLMQELAKIKRAMQKLNPNVPQEILLVLDASTGQNAFEQAKQFLQVTEINALALTKLDGTARGGVAIGISDQLQVPIKYIGIGEGVGDLQPFDKEAFVDSLFA